MKKVLLAQASACALAMLVAGCGGGGMNGPGSNPPPSGPAPSPSPSPGPSPSPSPTPTPPPTTANADLVTLTKDESFTNDAALGTLNVPFNSSSTASAAPTKLTITYRASSHNYTVTDGNRTRTFTAADIDASQSSDLVTTYLVTDGSTTDSLVLTKAGTNPGQTRYVASGYWQRTTEGSTAVMGSIDAFTYGVETPDSALPRSGAATYDVTLLGIETIYSNIYALGGAGALQADFGSGAIGGKGRFGMSDPNTGALDPTMFQWQAYALLDSKHNRFAGIIQLDNLPDAGLVGRFYGPHAEEIGATWSAGGGDIAAVGTLQGAQDGVPVDPITNFPLPEHDSIFGTLSTGIAATTNPDGTVASTQAATPLAAVYVPEYGGYHFYGTDGTIFQFFPGGDPSYTVGDRPTDYLRAGLLTDLRDGGANVSSFLFGFATASDAMPRAGVGAYNIGLRAGLDHKGAMPSTIDGYGRLNISFADGTIGTTGDYSVYNRPPTDSFNGGAVVDTGTWSGAAKIGSGSSTFSGTLSLDGATDYAGAMNGQFYGPDANEVGAVFALTNKGGDEVSGYLSGSEDAALSKAYSPLADLAGQTQMTALSQALRYTHLYGGPNQGVGDGYDQLLEGNAGGYDLYFDPRSSSARLVITPQNYPDSPVVHAGDDNYDAAASTAAFTAYTGARAPAINPGPYQLRDYIFDGKDGRISLTYTGFAALYADEAPTSSPPGDPPSVDEHDAYFMPYGNGTPIELMPRSGSASYLGVVYGRGGIYTSEPNTAYYDLAGTSALGVDFGKGTMTASLAMTGTALDGGGALDFGSYAFAGKLGSYDFGSTSGTAGFYATTNNAKYSGAFMGSFFGPHAEEFGGIFNVDVTGANGINGYVRGGTVGKKDAS